MLHRRLIPGLILLLLSSSALTAQLRSREVSTALDDLRRKEPDAVAVEIAAYGPGIAPTLLDALEAGLPREDGPDRLSSLERRVVLRALGNIGRDLVRPMVEKELSKSGTTLSDETALAVFGEIGRASDLSRALEIATPERWRHSVDRRLAAELQTTCERILRRDSRGFRMVRSLALDARPELRKALIEGLAATRSREALSSLANMLGLLPELDADLLGHIAAVSEGLRPPLEEEVCGEVRPYLWEADRRLCREAIFAVGALRDTEALGRLVQILKEEEGALEVAAHQALQKITGLNFEDEPTRWGTWLATEKIWYRDEGVRLIQALENGKSGPAGHALNQVVQRRLYYGRIAPYVEGLLERDDPALRRKACAALARMGSWAQVPRLVDTLDDPEEAVAQAAHAALLALTKRDLPPSSPVWQEVAESVRNES